MSSLNEADRPKRQHQGVSQRALIKPCLRPETVMLLGVNQPISYEGKKKKKKQRENKRKRKTANSSSGGLSAELGGQGLCGWTPQGHLGAFALTGRGGSTPRGPMFISAQAATHSTQMPGSVRKPPLLLGSPEPWCRCHALHLTPDAGTDLGGICFAHQWLLQRW